MKDGERWQNPSLQRCQNGCLCAQLPQKLSCDTLLGAEAHFVNGNLTTGTVAWPHGKEDEVAESAFPDFIFYYFSSSHMRIINFHVSREKFEWMNHKSSKLRKEIKRIQLLLHLNPQLVKPIWNMEVRLVIPIVPCSGDGTACPSLHQDKV